MAVFDGLLLMNSIGRDSALVVNVYVTSWKLDRRHIVNLI